MPFFLSNSNSESPPLYIIKPFPVPPIPKRTTSLKKIFDTIQSIRNKIFTPNHRDHITHVPLITRNTEARSKAGLIKKLIIRYIDRPAAQRERGDLVTGLTRSRKSRPN